MSLTWRKKNYRHMEVYYADRPNGDELNVMVHQEGTHTIFVYSPSTNTEYFDGEIPDTTIKACMERAESVRLPEEDTGI